MGKEKESSSSRMNTLKMNTTATTAPGTRTRVVTKALKFGGSKSSKAPRKAPRKAPAKPKRATKAAKANETNLFDFNFGKLFGAQTYYDDAASGSKATSKEKAVGYRGSGEKGSAPNVDAQGKKARLGGRVYQFADKYGNIDEYSPIWTPETRAPGADTYEPGLAGIAVWFVGFVGLLGTGAFAVTPPRPSPTRFLPSARTH